tara:strand:+ start:15314 stop:15715 length:402 start_codon:yes stop_codon:yes gene_type:complete
MQLETQTKKIMKNAIVRYAKEEEIETKRIQLLIYTDNPDLEPKYKVLKDNKEFKKVSFNDILNVKLDFLGREILATPFITNTIKRLMRESNCEFKEVNVLVYLTDVAEDVNLFFFVGTKANKSLGFDYLFNEI